MRLNYIIIDYNSDKDGRVYTDILSQIMKLMDEPDYNKDDFRIDELVVAVDEENGSEVIGFVCINEDYGEVFLNTYVRKEWRHKGIATSIIQKTKEYLATDYIDSENEFVISYSCKSYEQAASYGLNDILLGSTLVLDPFEVKAHCCEWINESNLAVDYIKDKDKLKMALDNFFKDDNNSWQIRNHDSQSVYEMFSKDILFVMSETDKIHALCFFVVSHIEERKECNILSVPIAEGSSYKAVHTAIAAYFADQEVDVINYSVFSNNDDEHKAKIKILTNIGYSECSHFVKGSETNND